MYKSVVIACVCLAAAPWARAQEIHYGIGGDDPTVLSKEIPKLAEQVIPAYHDDDPVAFLDNLFRLQIAVQRYDQSAETLTRLGGLLEKSAVPQIPAARVPYVIFVQAKIRQERDGTSFEEAFQQAFRDAFQRMPDERSARVIRTLQSDQSRTREQTHALLKRLAGQASISLADALNLIRQSQAVEVYQSFAPLLTPLIAADDHRRYVIEDGIRVPTPDGANLCVRTWRPRHGPTRVPTLLDFTIYNVPAWSYSAGRRTASNGYAAVEGLVRGKGCSPDKIVVYEHDGADATTLIEWIARQSWSDGRVGMWGGSYSGFTQWAAAKHMPKALKAMMPMAPGAPGIDVPMEGNVFMNFVYPWPFYVTDNKTVDDDVYNQHERWSKLYHDWYVSGRAYRDLDRIDGTPNPFFDLWLQHPTYDAYWQSMVPFESEFARIKIPVLTTIGYYGGGAGAGVYYLTEHYKYNPAAEHYLLIGPYDHFTAQRGMLNELGEPETTVSAGYALDPVALIDISELRYQWFNYVLKGGPRPDLLQDKINYEVMGANVWKHAPSLAAMSSGSLRFYLTGPRSGAAYKMGPQNTAPDAFTPLTVDFKDRSDVDRTAPDGIVGKTIDTHNAIEFISEPLAAATEVSGLLSGQLKLVANKKDVDFQIAVYELTADNDYVLLTTYQSRASHVGDLLKRRLLVPGRHRELSFTSIRLTSRRVAAASRLVVVLGIIKDPGLEINYGTGKDVAHETIADATAPTTVKWLAESYVDIPIHK